MLHYTFLIDWLTPWILQAFLVISAEYDLLVTDTSDETSISYEDVCFSMLHGILPYIIVSPGNRVLRDADGILTKQLR